MTLSSWFRDYIYIPLGGNRKGLPKQIRNILVVWALTRSLAWSILEFCTMGIVFWSITNNRKTVYAKGVRKTAEICWTHIYNAVSISKLGNICF